MKINKNMKINKIIQGDCIEEMSKLDENSVNLVITSPPYADTVSYGKSIKNFHPDHYADWFADLGKEIQRVLTTDGSFILNIGNKASNGQRSLYIMKTVIALVEQANLGFHDEYIWHKPCSIPAVSSRRLNNVFEYIFHFVKTPLEQKTYMDRVREDYAEGTKKMVGQIQHGYNKITTEKGESVMTPFTRKINEKGKVPDTIFHFNTAAATSKEERLYDPVAKKNILHPAAFHKELPTWFINWLTDKNDLIVDPFMGSGTTALAAWESGRNFIGFELNEHYADLLNNLLNNKMLVEF